MPIAAVIYAGEVTEVRTPEEFVGLRDSVRQHHHEAFYAITTALDERFGHADGPWMGCMRAAAEMALMAQVGTDLIPGDRARLRGLWKELLQQ